MCRDAEDTDAGAVGQQRGHRVMTVDWFGWRGGLVLGGVRKMSVGLGFSFEIMMLP